MSKEIDELIPAPEQRAVLNRRRFLVACAGHAAGTAGCISFGNGSGREESGEPSRTETAPMEANAYEFPPDHCQPNRASGDDEQLGVPFDSREQFGCAGILLDGMEDPGPWQTYDGRFGPDSERVTRGSQSAQLETIPPDGRVWAYRRFDSGLDLSNHDLSIAIHPGRGETKASMLRAQVLAPDYQNRIDMRHGVGKLRGWFRMDLGPTVVKGHPDLTDVRELRLQSLAKSQKRIRLNVDELRLVPKASRGRVMLTFDDIPMSQYTEAFPRMNDRGFAGVAGAIPGLTSSPDFLSADQLRELQNAGWDVVSHPQLTDPSRPLPTLSRAAQDDALRRSKQWLLDQGFERGARFVIWPFQAAGATTLALGARYHALGFAGGWPPCGIPPTDPLTIGRVDGERVEQTLRMIEFAERYNLLTVVMFHEVGPNGLASGKFEQILEAVERADVTVVTATDLWELMTE